jgi:predicted  nucleic acid-binding Zn-ribbon protein
MRELSGANLDDLNTALDSDVDAEEYEALASYIQSAADETKDFSDELKYNETAAKKTAAAILRFNSAIESINENYEDWNYILK